MPYKTPFFVSLVAFYQRHTEPINAVIITILAVIGRALYTGSERKKICGDLIICSLITLIFYPRIPDKIEILKHTFAVSPSEVAIVVGILGIHGMRIILKKAVKKKTGMDLD